VTPPEVISQYDFDIQLFSGKRFTCRVESQEARSEWIQALEVARSSGIPGCPLYDPTAPPYIQDLLATLWPLRFSVSRWRAETEARAAARAAAAATRVTSSGSETWRPQQNRRTNGDGDGGTGRERARSADDLTPDVNRDCASENADARGDGNEDDGSDDDEAPASQGLGPLAVV